MLFVLFDLLWLCVFSIVGFVGAYGLFLCWWRWFCIASVRCAMFLLLGLVCMYRADCTVVLVVAIVVVVVFGVVL